MRTIGGGEGAKYSMFAFGGTIRAARLPFLPPRLRPPFPPSYPPSGLSNGTRCRETQRRGAAQSTQSLPLRREAPSEVRSGQRLR